MRQVIRPAILCALFSLSWWVMMPAAQEDGAPVDPLLARKAATLILTRCAVCHTTDLIAQQRLPEERWTATVEKMIRWGAELSSDEVAVLLQFLTTRYHPGASDNLPSIENELAMMGPILP